MSDDLSDKSIVPDAKGFKYKEDYILFGLLVRHGLVDMDDYEPLAHYQRGNASQPLMDMLCESSETPDKVRKDLQTLLNLLSEPELKNYLPAELPMMETVQDFYHKSTIQHGSMKHLAQTEQLIPTPWPTRQLKGKSSDEPTVRYDDETKKELSTTRKKFLDSTSIDGSLLSSLTKDEIQRIEKSQTFIPLVGKVFSNHVIIDKIGGGGQGDVYLAKQLSLNRYVALKRLHGQSITEDNQFFQIFREEARTLGRINHPNIVQVYDIFSEEGQAFFTMESIEGQTIKEMMTKADGPLELDLMANLACQACSALSRTSEDSLVHRDIKPANVMLDKNGNLKIVDFGLAAAAASLDENSGFAGTPVYAAPEMFGDKKLTPSVDQYSLAVTLYEALTGHNPFRGTRMMEVGEKHKEVVPEPPSKINSDLPREVDAVLLKMLAKTPEERYKTFDECYDAWNRILTGKRTKSKVPNAALLGESLLRLSKEEANALFKRGSILTAVWLAMTAGVMWGHGQFSKNDLGWVLDQAGNIGTAILVFSLFCIFYVAMARRNWLPVIGSLRVWLITHISTAIPAVILILLHSGNFLNNIMPGPPQGRPILSILITTVLIVTAVSGSVGLLIFRALRRQIQLQEMGLRKGEKVSPRQAMMMALSAQLLSGWRLVHYPLAVLFIVLTIVHIYVSLQFQGP